tara:strand:+ start:105 stop:734 length:630 start_codon:yes stop_codon:yes gene_type:complete
MTRARDFADVISGNFAIPSGSLGNAVPADGSITTAKLATGAAASNLGTSVNLDTIKDATGTTTALTIDSSGRLIKSVTPFAFVTFPNTGTYVSKALNTTLDFSNAVLNDGNHYDTSTYKFTCPEDGLYHLELSSLSENNSDSYAIHPVRTSGGTEVELVRWYTNYRAIAGASFTVKCQANDTLHFKTAHTMSFYQSTVKPYNWATFKLL